MAQRSYLSVLPVLVGAGLLALAYGAVLLGDRLTPGAEPLSLNPVAMAAQLISGQREWPASATWLLAAAVGIGVVVLFVAVLRPRKQGAPRRPADDSAEARLSADRKGLRRVQQSARAKEAEQMHPGSAFAVPGVRVGVALTAPHAWVMGSFRQCSAHIWGPGRGKTLTQVVRHAADAPGPYAMTSNKTDGVALVIAARAATHPDGQVWLFDADQIFRRSSRPAFTFDLLASVDNSQAAVQLAEVFETASQRGDERSDAQFDPQGRQYLAWLLLAASVSGRPLAKVHEWVSAGQIDEPQEILREHGHRGAAAALVGLSNQPERMRGSVFGVAQRMASPMVHDHLMAWVQPVAGVPVFDPARFVTSTDTLIMLTNESAGAGAAFVSGLVRMTFEAAQRTASRQASERLPQPFVTDLDECGNVVRLKELPEWFTHFGSKGIIVNAYFQSPSQGEEMFGRTRFRQLWDAAGVRVYGGGVDEPDWLSDLSKLFGTYERRQTSVSASQAGPRSESTSWHQADRISVAELSDLAEWRAVVRTSNGVSTIVETVPVFRDKAFAAIVDDAARIKQATEAA